jgi:hypothetical protein
MWSTYGNKLFSQGEKRVSFMILAFFSLARPISLNCRSAAQMGRFPDLGIELTSLLAVLTTN